jgi:hypothetical protein
MANLLLETETEQSLEARLVHVGERAISFECFLDMAEGHFVGYLFNAKENESLL